MQRGVFISFMGLGAKAFSAGMAKLAARMAAEHGWQTATYRWFQWEKAFNEFGDFGGFVVVAGHSAGATGINEFAQARREMGLPTQVGVFVDAWLGFQEDHWFEPLRLDDGFDRVVSVQAEELARFHVKGGSVVDRVVIPDTTHTTVDDSEGLADLVYTEIARLSGGGSSPALGAAPLPPASVPEGKMFERWTPVFMKLLMQDFGVSAVDAAAVFGNAGHESAGYETLQEIKPLVPGSRGGWGIMQWTGPRRREFEAYCTRNGYDPASMMVNYKWLFVELKGPEGRVLGRLHAAPTLDSKTRIFSDTFLRPGIPHMESRLEWARRALEIWQEAGEVDVPTAPLPPAAPPPSVPANPPAGPPADTAADLGSIEAFLEGRYPASEAEARARAAMLAEAIAYAMDRSRPLPSANSQEPDVVSMINRDLKDRFTLPPVSQPAQPKKEKTMRLGYINKLLGALLGGGSIVTLAQYILPPELATTEFIAALGVIFSGIGTYIAPRNDYS